MRSSRLAERLRRRFGLDDRAAIVDHAADRGARCESSRRDRSARASQDRSEARSSSRSIRTAPVVRSLMA